MTPTPSRWPGLLFLLAGWLALLAGCVVHRRCAPIWVDEFYSFNLIQDPAPTTVA